MNPEDFLFPFSYVRDEQKELLQDVASAIEQRKALLAHAPTGIGKTAATLPPALSYALKNGKTVFFLTPKHSQHHIVVETLEKIRDRFKKKIVSVDIIGKQWTCLYEGARDLTSAEFNQFCQAHKRNETCRFLNNINEPGTKNLSDEAKDTIHSIKAKSPLHSEEILEECRKEDLCPYEVCMEVGRSANVIICDYYHLFHPSVRKAFLGKLGKSLEEMILIVDEAHNLPERVRKLMSHSLSEFSLNNAIKETKALRNESLQEALEGLSNVLRFSGKSMKAKEAFIKKHDFIRDIESELGEGIEPLVDDLENFGEVVLEEPNRFRSYCLSVAHFLNEWVDEEKNESAFARILDSYKSNTGIRYQLSLKCLDPALFTREVFGPVHASILMSGTLLPMDMYENVLGLSGRALMKQYHNPFPPGNRLVLLTHGITTKYTHRSPHMYGKIARSLSSIINSVPKNAAVFFPSYDLMNDILKLSRIEGKELLIEKKEMEKKERRELYKRMVELSEGRGAALFAVQAGSFSEGMDFPGRVLDCVVVVGLPLEKPTLETESLINYYDFKFGRGWDFGYTYPAMNRALQAAGRCIRSESDRGAIVLMDDRFKWKNYKKCFPEDFQFIITEKPEIYIRKFFSTEDR
ncbi:MAG: ATP-dependent DNA helicase [Candidatus Altiarchaeota archaeon]|nr:ATP-dependent DNA helicase [Candidatus Altiarchaeota archaeon]